jgi:hypothetical protein
VQTAEEVLRAGVVDVLGNDLTVPGFVELVDLGKGRISSGGEEVLGEAYHDAVELSELAKDAGSDLGKKTHQYRTKHDGRNGIREREKKAKDALLGIPPGFPLDLAANQSARSIRKRPSRAAEMAPSCPSFVSSP